MEVGVHVLSNEKSCGHAGPLVGTCDFMFFYFPGSCEEMEEEEEEDDDTCVITSIE